MGVRKHMQTEQASDRAVCYDFPNVVAAEVISGKLYVYKSVIVDDNDELMIPVWGMPTGPLTLVHSELYPDDTMLFGEAIGRVFTIGE